MTAINRVSEPADLSLPRVLVIAGATAAANVLTYYAAVALNLFQTDLIVPDLGGPISVGLIAVASLTSVLIAAAVKWLLIRLTPHHRRWFLAIAILVLAGSLIPPLTIPGATAGMQASLIAMHLVGGVIAVSQLNR